MRTALIAALIAAGSLSGCATKEFVLEETGKVDRRVAALEQALAEARAKVQERLKKNDARMDAQDVLAATQAKNLLALGEQQRQTDQSVTEHGKQLAGLHTGLESERKSTQKAMQQHDLRLVSAEQGLQRVNQELTGAQARTQMLTHQLEQVRGSVEQQDKRVAGLSAGVDAGKQEAQQTFGAHDQRITGTEQGLQKVGQDLAGAKAEAKADAQALNQQLGQTQGHVEQQGKKVDTLLTGLDASKQTLTDHAQRLHKAEGQVVVAAQERATLSATANDALTRATAAGKLAEGKLMYASVLNHELSGFKLDQADLGDDAKAALKDFADKLKAENANVYLEIQGHTDTSGKAETNRLLSQRRAEAVRDFLYAEGGIPLHRMAVFAYGGSRPVADNKKRDGRVQNRRVMIVVLK